ncbi:unnamed protein product [Allacma fusca]|uniref:CARD domain-containing protein n=1 Tax=Allacma fusca TaxID=39272 RepID=A0A8J2J787_9HEXA|nr:unnamed protein product [Allacma fusca]
MSSNSIIRAVLRECHERLVDELQGDQVIKFLYSHGFISERAKKSIISEKNPVVKIKECLNILEDCKNEEALDSLINYLRNEGTQPHLWTLLEYSRVKHRRLRSNMLATCDSI